MLSNSYLQEKVKILLGIEDTTLYDARLEMLVGGAVAKLESEGVDNDFSEPAEGESLDNLAMDYLICVSYQVALDLNLDIDLQTFYVQYITRVNTLRCSKKAKQS